MSIAQEEIFGPAAAGMRVEDYGGGLAVANDARFGLSLTMPLHGPAT